jgi:LmbE family N-acetylglucosaminyl deacetylase
VRPDRLVCQSSERNYQRIFASHPDHLAAGEAALCAVYPDARNPFAHPELAEEGLEAHTVSDVWIMASTQADVYVDITEHFDAKMDALHCHVSQHPQPDGLDERMRMWTSSTAEAGGLRDGRLAEAFMRIRT